MKKINWNTITPEIITLKDLENAKKSDFPNTYTGRAWVACWLMYHKGYKKDKQEFLKLDGWGNFPYLKEMDLTGFMVGWACNTLRYLLNEKPVRDGATVIVGGGDNQPVGVPDGNADESLNKSLRS